MSKYLNKVEIGGTWIEFHFKQNEDICAISRLLDVDTILLPTRARLYIPRAYTNHPILCIFGSPLSSKITSNNGTISSVASPQVNESPH